jgi:hypothetical protein
VGQFRITELEKGTLVMKKFAFAVAFVTAAVSVAPAFAWCCAADIPTKELSNAELKLKKVCRQFGGDFVANDLNRNSRIVCLVGDRIIYPSK